MGTYMAQVAEVDVSKEGGVRVRRVVCAVDCGSVANPTNAIFAATGKRLRKLPVDPAELKRA
jgi:CO/xanthine dehydrogenase Mo-binding subunit